MWLKRINSKKFTLCVILSAWSVKIYDLIYNVYLLLSRFIFFEILAKWRSIENNLPTRLIRTIIICTYIKK